MLKGFQKLIYSYLIEELTKKSLLHKTLVALVCDIFTQTIKSELIYPRENGIGSFMIELMLEIRKIF